MIVVAILISSRFVCAVFSPKMWFLKSFALLLGCTSYMLGVALHKQINFHLMHVAVASLICVVN